MLPDQVSNPGPLTYESGAYRLRYAARRDRPKMTLAVYNGRKTTTQHHPNDADEVETV